MNYLNDKRSVYFSATDLKKILIEVHPNPMLLLSLTDRSDLIKEIVELKEKLINIIITEDQFEYLQKTKHKNTEPEYYTLEEQEIIESYFRLYENSPIKKNQENTYKAFINVGFRVTELCDFDRDAIDKYNYRVRIFGKGKKWRWTHVDPGFIDFLLKIKENIKIIEAKNSDDKPYHPLFLNSDGNQYTPRAIQKFMDTIYENLKDKGLTKKMHPHILRHTYAVNRIINNPSINMEELRNDMGHADIRTTQIYFALADAERIKLVKKREEKKIIQNSIKNELQTEISISSLEQLKKKCDELGISIDDYIKLKKGSV